MVKGHKKNRLFVSIFGKSKGDIAFNIINYFLFLLLFIACLYPFIYVLVISLTATKVVGEESVQTFSVESYITILGEDGLGKTFLLSVATVIVYVLCSVSLTLLSAYPLTKKLKGRKFFLVFLLICMLFSGGLIPYYLMIKQLGLFNNWLVYIFVGLINPFHVIIMKNFISAIPEDMFESARIDGASEFRILWQIVLPLSGPIIATVALWAGVSKWNDWMTGVLYMQNNRDLWLIQQFLQNILATSSPGQGTVDPDIMSMSKSIKMAAIVISIIPIIIVYPFVQKHFVKGTMLGAVKG